MCAIYGFLDYGKKVSTKMQKTLIRQLSVAAECRGTDATGISYVKDGAIVTFKLPKPAHKTKLYFPKDTSAVIGHNRFTTQGSEKKNCNNHPFEGRTPEHGFALAHNGILYNDREIRRTHQLPLTQIETDSYAAVQLLEQEKSLNMESIRQMAEIVEGTFVFTILRSDNTLFLVRGDNPLTIYHFPALGLYVYASTKEILHKGLQAAKFTMPAVEIPVKMGEIIGIEADGKLFRDSFEIKDDFRYGQLWHDWMCQFDSEDDEEDDLLLVCGYFGVDREEVKYLRSCGYTTDEIEEMLLDLNLLDDALKEAKTLRNTV
ncbi:MAG: class II glutamine amidotransferase [Oscillospiraceae bacterium]|nr:class II glutamine amidotransferase [Oscillospiraceae bacterium]